MSDKLKHPAKFTDTFIPIFANNLRGCKAVLDPFAGTGKLALIKNHGFEGKVVCAEIEQEWTEMGLYNVDEWHVGDSQNMDWAEDSSFDAVCTSPTYGNRMADHFESNDDSRRITYRHYLGRPLDENNSGRMQWGEKYRQLHKAVYKECVRVLKPGGKLILNVSNHIRGGVEINVSLWHRLELKRLGFVLVGVSELDTPRHRHGRNHNLRVGHENIFVFELDKVE